MPSIKKKLHQTCVSCFAALPKYKHKYGVFGWHLDHIIPCERFDLTNEDHCRVCFNWRNIRPLWGEDNCNRQEMLTLDEVLGIDPQLIKMVEEIGVKLW